MPYYRYHVFFCTNQREAGRQCCGQCGSSDLRDYLKDRVKALGLSGRGGVRINTAGCLDRCAAGPVIVIYPESIWYTYSSRNDLEEILHEHLIHGRHVERLKLPE